MVKQGWRARHGSRWSQSLRAIAPMQRVSRASTATMHRSNGEVRMEFGSIRTGGCSYEVRMKFVRTNSVCCEAEGGQVWDRLGTDGAYARGARGRAPDPVGGTGRHGAMGQVSRAAPIRGGGAQSGAPKMGGARSARIETNNHVTPQRTTRNHTRCEQGTWTHHQGARADACIPCVYARIPHAYATRDTHGLTH